MKSSIKKLVLLVLCALFVVGCSSGASTHKSDMSGYEGFDDENHVFVDATMKEINDMINKGETFTVYFGFKDCPWCIAALPYLNEIAKEYNQPIYYVDTRKDPSWESNIDIDDYDLFVEQFGEYVPYDDDGIKHLYTPHVFFVKKGKVVYDHDSTVEDHVAYEREMTAEEVETLKAYYKEGFESLK